jgi:transcriptional regulator with XRE-family HTH domain
MSKDIIFNKKLVSRNLKKLRQIKEFTHKDVAKLTSIAQSTISACESGKRFLKPIALRKLLSAYDYSLTLFASHTQDEIEKFPFDSNAIVQTKRHKLLLDGLRDEDKMSLFLLRPIKKIDELAFYELNLPPDSEWPEKMISFDCKVHGIVQSGSLLIELEKDEFRVDNGEEFRLDKNTKHVYRNFTNEKLVVNLILEKGLI